MLKQSVAWRRYHSEIEMQTHDIVGGWITGSAVLTGFQASRKRRSSQLRVLPGGMARITAAALR
jgi:hypothetical protein